MKKYYVTVTSVFNNGRVSCNLVDCVEAEEKPESGFKSTRRCDIYVDYFESLDEAKQFIEESRCA